MCICSLAPVAWEAKSILFSPLEEKKNTGKFGNQKTNLTYDSRRPTLSRVENPLRAAAKSNLLNQDL